MERNTFTHMNTSTHTSYIHWNTWTHWIIWTPCSLAHIGKLGHIGTLHILERLTYWNRVRFIGVFVSSEFRWPISLKGPGITTYSRDLSKMAI